ncbi:MAG: twin-arginine translocase subunit TatC [Bacteroidia bacterium]
MKSEHTNNQGEMSFLDHLEELRWHIIRSAVAVLIMAILAFTFSRYIFDYIIVAPKSPDFITYRLLCKITSLMTGDDSLCIKEIPITLINIEMAGQFSTDVIVSFFSGLILAFPYVVWEIWQFLKPALHENERKNTRGFVFYVSILFITGVLFGYYLILPLSVNFLGNYKVSEEVFNQISLGSYISTTVTLCMSSGIVFQLPILVYILSRLGLITPDFMRKYRKHSIIVVLFISAIITPPDITSQILVSIPIIILYEISIFISASVQKKLLNKNT